jgi:hypothetical protein
MALTAHEEMEVRQGAERFFEGLKELAPGGADEAAGLVAELAQGRGRAKIEALISDLADDQFLESFTTLKSVEAQGFEEALHAAGGKGRFGRYVIRAFQKRLCNNPDASEKLRQALEEAAKQGVKIATPSSVQLAVGAASVVAVAVGTFFTGPIAVALAPFIGGIALLIVQCGVDAFCSWTDDSQSTSS